MGYKIAIGADEHGNLSAVRTDYAMEPDAALRLAVSIVMQFNVGNLGPGLIKRMENGIVVEWNLSHPFFKTYEHLADRVHVL